MLSNLLKLIKAKLRQGAFRSLVIPLYREYKRIIYPPPRIAYEKSRFLDSEKWSPEEYELLKKVSHAISPRDWMYTGYTGSYFIIGLSAIRCINEAISYIPQNPKPINTILDLPCGYGRVLRFLVHRFPKAQITACEIDRKAVDYCVSRFGAKAAYSSPDLKTLDLDANYDLIWCGSLITHMDAEGINDLLDFFHRHLAPGGLLVFTTHGDFMAKRIMESFDLSLTPQRAVHLSSSFKDSGFAYSDAPHNPGSGFGFSLTSRQWINKELGKFDGWRLVYIGENKWENAQDVYGVMSEN